MPDEFELVIAEEPEYLYEVLPLLSAAVDVPELDPLCHQPIDRPSGDVPVFEHGSATIQSE